MALKIAHYWKYLIAILGFMAVTVSSALSDGKFTSTDLVQIVLALATALTVYVLPNATAGVAKYVKEIVAVLGFIATYVIPAVVSAHFTSTNYVNVGIQVVVAILIALKGNLPLPVTPSINNVTNFNMGPSAPQVAPPVSPPAADTPPAAPAAPSAPTTTGGTV